jgi:hypothetical protein
MYVVDCRFVLPGIGLSVDRLYSIILASISFIILFSDKIQNYFVLSVDLGLYSP